MPYHNDKSDIKAQGHVGFKAGSTPAVATAPLFINKLIRDFLVASIVTGADNSGDSLRSWPIGWATDF